MSAKPGVKLEAWVPRIVRKNGRSVLPTCRQTGAYGLLYETKAGAEQVVRMCEKQVPGSVGAALRATVTIEFI